MIGLDRAAVLCAALALAGGPAPAAAWTSGSRFTDPCHETLTLEAVRQAGFPDGAAPPQMADYDRLIANDLGFDLEAGERDPWRLAMVIGVRDIDNRGHELDDLPAIAHEAARNDRQADHCLRRAEDDGTEGNASAVAACRAFIRAHVEAALGPDDQPDLAALEDVQVPLVFRQETHVDINRFGLNMGRALHALQDSFTHTFRTPDGQRVTHVLNYVDDVEERLEEPRDGHVHMSNLDRCTNMTPLRERNFNEAGLASAELLAAVNDPTGGRAGRLARVDQVLDRWLSVEGGCTVDNGYCAAAELEEPAAGCEVAMGVPAWPALLVYILIAGVLCMRRRRRWPGAGLGAGAVAAALMLALAAPAAAQSPESPEGSQGVAVPEPGEEEVVITGVDPEHGDVIVEERRVADPEDLGDPVERGLGFSFGVSGSIDEESLGVALGLRLDVASWFILGVDGEYNPWFSISSGNHNAGTFNAYLTGIFIYGVLGPVELRTTVHAGVSVLMSNLVGADRGSLGPFFGITPLGVAWRITRRVRFVIDPGGFFVSIPQLTGITYIRRMHRAALGLTVTL